MEVSRRVAPSPPSPRAYMHMDLMHAQLAFENAVTLALSTQHSVSWMSCGMQGEALLEALKPLRSADVATAAILTANNGDDETEGASAPELEPPEGGSGAAAKEEHTLVVDPLASTVV